MIRGIKKKPNPIIRTSRAVKIAFAFFIFKELEVTRTTRIATIKVRTPPRQALNKYSPVVLGRILMTVKSIPAVIAIAAFRIVR